MYWITIEQCFQRAHTRHSRCTIQTHCTPIKKALQFTELCLCHCARRISFHFTWTTRPYRWHLKSEWMKAFEVAWSSKNDKIKVIPANSDHLKCGQFAPLPVGGCGSIICVCCYRRRIMCKIHKSRTADANFFRRSKNTLHDVLFVQLVCEAKTR